MPKEDEFFILHALLKIRAENTDTLHVYVPVDAKYKSLLDGMHFHHSKDAFWIDFLNTFHPSDLTRLEQSHPSVDRSLQAFYDEFKATWPSDPYFKAPCYDIPCLYANYESTWCKLLVAVEAKYPYDIAAYHQKDVDQMDHYLVQLSFGPFKVTSPSAPVIKHAYELAARAMIRIVYAHLYNKSPLFPMKHERERSQWLTWTCPFDPHPLLDNDILSSCFVINKARRQDIIV